MSDRIAVVVNGNAKSVSSEVIATLDEILDSGDLFISRRVEDSEGIARTLVDRGYGTILTAGGDGTFTVVVTAVVREARRQGTALPRFGLLRLGTGNSLAWALGASKSTEGAGRTRALTADLSRLRADAGSREMHLIEAEGTISPFCGYGVDAAMLNDYNTVKKVLSHSPLRRWASGPLSYAVATVTRTFPTFLLRRTPHCRVLNLGSDAVRMGPRGGVVGSPVPAGAVLYEGPAKVVACGAIPYYGFGFRFFPYADERPDRVHLRISDIDGPAFVFQFPKIWRGEYENLENTFDYLVDDVEVEMDPPTFFQVGGDVRGERSRVRMTMTEPIRICDFYSPPRV